MLTSIIADDLTGAADAGVQFLRAGYRTGVVFHGAEMPAAGLDAVSLDTDSRTRPARFAAERVVEAARAVRDARLFYKKLDSTLRGNVAVELAAVFRASGRERVIVAPAFPVAGRTTREGIQLVHGVPVDETEMRDDPRTPVTGSHVPTLLVPEFASVGTLHVEDLADQGRVRLALEENECVVADAGCDADLEALVRAVPEPGSVLWAGSAGLAHALGGVYPGPRAGQAGLPRTQARPVLVVVGSLSGIARQQMRRLDREYGEVAVEVGGAGAWGNTVAAARHTLAERGCAVVHSPARKNQSRVPILGPLAEAVVRLSRGGYFGGLVLTGGSTAVKVARRLGASGIGLTGEVEAGVPMGALLGPNPYPVITKAGGFGGPDTLVGAVEALARGAEETIP
jgi:D-threonate/D-erythronate kinase